MESFDSHTFKIRDASSYDSVTQQFDYFTERLSHPLVLHLISLASIDQNHKILDVGTGTGVVAIQAAQMIGSGGMVHGIDLSKEMLVKAEEKVGNLNLNQKVRFSQMDAESLDFADQEFDVVLSLFALLHFPNPLVALKEIYRVLCPGGKLVLAVGSGAPLFSVSGWIHLIKTAPSHLRNLQGKQLVAPHFLDRLVTEHIPENSEPVESRLAGHSHNRTGTVASLVAKAGFDVLKTDWHGHREVINSPQEFWEIQRTFSSIARKRLSKATPEAIESLHNKFMEKCLEIQSRGGTLVYPFGAFYVVARRPA